MLYFLKKEARAMCLTGLSESAFKRIQETLK